jgi:hypothetical protein
VAQRAAIVSQRLKATAWGGVLRNFWLAERLAAARRQGFAPGQPGWEEFALARSLLARGEAVVAASRSARPAALMYRSAVRLLVGARLAREREGAEDTACDSAQALAALLDQKLDLVVAQSLGEEGERFLARLSLSEAAHAARELRRLAVLLAAPLVEATRPVTRVLWRRWLRVAVLVVLATAGCWAALRRPNWALGRPVAATNNDHAVVKNTGQLVDGNKSNLGFHSTKSPHVVVIDLGSERKISRVVVYNRGDCCAERALPLRIELGDGKSFKRVAERTSAFEVWRARVPPSIARYVRLESTNSQPFHLAEVEVY